VKQRSRSTKPKQTASGISRRSFLKSTGVGLAGAAGVTALRPRISVAAPVTLSIWTGFPEIEQFYKKAGEEYAKKNPGFKLETLSSELRGMEQKIAAAIPTDTGPDLFDVSRNIALTLIDANLLPADPPKVMSLLKSNAFHPVTIEYNTWKGQVYGVPFLEGSKPALFYNTIPTSRRPPSTSS
jgi:multiple sugar transport system substrate-binding protein